MPDEPAAIASAKATLLWLSVFIFQLPATNGFLIKLSCCREPLMHYALRITYDATRLK
jgi:hypothetical protein